MSKETSSPIHHILVALNASPHSQAALDAAVRLAMDFEAEVEGLFVEDETLLQAAQLPFAEEVRAFTASPRGLTDQRIQRQLRYQAEHAERTLRRTAKQAEVEHTFEVVEGDVTAELMTAAAEVDLLVLGKTSSASSRRHLGSTSRALLSDAPAPVLVLREVVPPQRPVLVYYDGSDAAGAALNVAVHLSRRSGPRPVTVLLPANDDAKTDRLRDEVQSQYAPSEAPLSVHALTPAESRRLSAFARREGGLVILPAGCTPLSHVPLRQFLYEIDRPVLVMR
jgi:nucleotide-binding universal stress UspA family protein